MEFVPPQDDYEIGQRMLDVLDERGWYQGALESRDGRVCLIGAMNIALFGQVHREHTTAGNAVWRQGWNRLRDILRRETRINWEQIGNWNDRASTSEEDVRLIIKQAFLSG